MTTDRSKSTQAPMPAVVGLAAWLVPGAGYWLLGQRARGVTVGVCVVALLVMGVFIGGARVIEAPGYDNHGQPIANTNLIDQVSEKPWSVAQIMGGPLAIAAGALSVYASRPDPSKPIDPYTGVRPSRGADSHSHVNEVAVLYTAVAGMLNLLAIIDSAHRAGPEAKESH